MRQNAPSSRDNPCLRLLARMLTSEGHCRYQPILPPCGWQQLQPQCQRGVRIMIISLPSPTPNERGTSPAGARLDSDARLDARRRWEEVLDTTYVRGKLLEY